MTRSNYLVAKDWITAAGFRAVVVLVFHDLPSHFCGYVAVPKDHPACVNAELEQELEVHGGITFSELNPEYPVSTLEPTYWLGYDCAHSGDKTYMNRHGVFRSLEFNIQECEKLASQLASLAPPPVPGASCP